MRYLHNHRGCTYTHLHVLYLCLALMCILQPVIYVYHISLALLLLVTTPILGMLLVYRPEMGGPINCNIPIRGVIIDL